MSDLKLDKYVVRTYTREEVMEGKLQKSLNVSHKQGYKVLSISDMVDETKSGKSRTIVILEKND